MIPAVLASHTWIVPSEPALAVWVEGAPARETVESAPGDFVLGSEDRAPGRVQTLVYRGECSGAPDPICGREEPRGSGHETQEAACPRSRAEVREHQEGPEAHLSRSGCVLDRCLDGSGEPQASTGWPWAVRSSVRGTAAEGVIGDLLVRVWNVVLGGVCLFSGSYMLTLHLVSGEALRLVVLGASGVLIAGGYICLKSGLRPRR